MPTENRSSNTREQLDALWRDIQDSALRSEDPPHVRFAAAILACPTPQPHPEPIAWMVGTAIWWTKEEAERDAAATGLQIFGLGPMTGAAPDEQRHGEPVAWLCEDGSDAWTAEKKNDAIAHNGTPGATIAAKYTQPLYTHSDPGEVERLRAALKFYADGEHYHFESGKWDTVSGEPLNILWCGDEPDFIEDGTVARAALKRQPS